MYGNPVIQIVEKIPLHTVEQLDRPGGVPCVREALHHAVVCNGNSRVSPRLRPFDQIAVRPRLRADGAEGVHVGEGGVGVQLHPLDRRGVLPGLVGICADAFWVQDQVAAVPVELDVSLHL